MNGENRKDLMLRFYESNNDFRQFVDFNAKSYGRTVDFELSTETAWQYYLSMQKGGCNEVE